MTKITKCTEYEKMFAIKYQNKIYFRQKISYCFKIYQKMAVMLSNKTVYRVS